MIKTNKDIKMKICGVCGDKAIGRNFGAITCESCKAFFRRTAFKAVAICSTNGKCTINIQNRRSCKKCRLNKCLAIGMIKELILKNNDNNCPNSPTIKSERDRTDSISSIDTNISSPIDSNNTSSIDSSLFDHEFDSMFENCYLSDEEIGAEIMEIEEFINSCSKSADSEVIERQVSELSIIPVVRPIATYNKDLNNIELKLLEELSTATGCLRIKCTPMTQKIVEYSRMIQYYTDSYAMSKMDEQARIYVKFCKKLNSFKDVCKDDQLALVKHGYFETYTWLSIEHFNFDEEYWTMCFDNGYTLKFSMNLIKAERVDLYNLVSKFFRNLSFDLIFDSTIRNLLSVITLFNPERPNVTHKELVKLKQQMYLYLLQRYLIQKYRSECESKEKCSKILNSMEELHVATKVQKQLDQVYKDFATPLLREFID